MKKYSLIAVILYLCIAHVSYIHAQTGITYFISENEILPNGSIMGIIENNNNDLFLVNINSDTKYLLHEIELLKINLKGEVLLRKVIDKNNLYNLTNVVKKSETDFSVFGNTSLNNSYEPFQINISNSGEVNSNIQIPQVYSTVISDAINYASNFMLLYSKIGKNDLYNISLHKVNAEAGNIEWLKKISSENNEEADKIASIASGGFYILGKKYNDAVTEFVSIIYRVDKTGNQLWKKAIDVPSNFNKQSIQLINEDELIYLCGYTKNPTGFSETRIIKLSGSGEEIASNNISEFTANGIEQITDDNYIIFGSEFNVDMQQIVTKGKFVIINKQLNELVTKTLDDTDKPDVILQNKIKTSSDFLCARKLANNKVALGGKVFMPKTTKNGEKFNVPLLMIINSDGTYDK